MQIKSNIDILIKKFQKLAEAGKSIDATEALTQGINAGRAAMMNRIFNKGLDADEVSLGKYTGKKYYVSKRRGAKNTKKQNSKFEKNVADEISTTGENQFTEYEKKRLADGRQIGYKDLEFTGSLRRSIVTASAGENKVGCFINNDKEKLIAEGQEKQIGKIRGSGRVRIFSLTKEEKLIIREQTKKALNQLYVRLFNA